MKKIVCTGFVAAVLALAVSFAAWGAGAPAKVSGTLTLVGGSASYRIDYASRGTTYEISGIKFDGPDEIPLAGNAFVRSDGALVLGWTETYDWNQHPWEHPIGTTHVVFPSGLGSPGTRETTYHGNGAPMSFIVTITAGPAKAAQSPAPSGENRAR